jgi:uncharacterized protein YjdB
MDQDGRVRVRAVIVALGLACSTLVGIEVAGASAGAAPRSATHPVGTRGAAAAPVSTFDPAGTAREWRRLVARPERARAAAACRPLRAVFYAATDWLRLATRLAANASPCAQYYVSIPPLVSDKTKPRPDQAFRIRALGANFHAMAEIHWTTWSRWVGSTGSTWYDAGVEARRRMAAAGYDVTKGDVWAVNEFPSSVRALSGADRTNARELVRGLYNGDGGTNVRGVVFVVGAGQRSTAIPLYQNNLQNWLTDSAFWTDMAAYVSDWSQEVYTDFRSYGVVGAAPSTRRDYLNDYLQHQLVLAGVGPPPIDTARAFIQSAYSPLANAAWQWDGGYGWTMVTVDQMQAFVSAQTYALRSFSVSTGQAQDHWGFAWHPRNATGLSPGDFTAQTAAILDRLAAAIHDSAETSTSDPGSGACGPPGQYIWCGGDLPGAAFTEAWKSFRTWTQPVLVFTSSAQTVPVASVSGPMSLALQTSSGGSQSAMAPISVTLSSSSPQGQFAVAPTGPWSTTLTLTIPAGGNAAGPFYYQDTVAGNPVLTAAAFGVTSGTQAETVLPGPVVGMSIEPSSVSVPAGAALTLTAASVDSFGNAVPAPATWSIVPGTIGALEPQGATALFTAGMRGGSGTITASVSGAAGPLSATATVTVKPGRIKVASIRYGIGRRTILASATVVDSAGRAVPGAVVRLIVRRNGYRYFLGQARTTTTGKAIYRLRSKKGCYRTSIIRAAAPGYVWRPATPANRFCK